MSDILWHAVGMHDVPSDDDWFDSFERDRFAAMAYEKRRSESRLSRWTAKTTAAAAFGLAPDRSSLERVTIRNAPDGAPEVFLDGEPTDWTVAMTDRADWAVTAIRRGEDRVGCDLELVEPRSVAFVADYFTPVEQALVAAGERDVVANLIWSAKESSLKVLRTGLRRDTRSVEVIFDPPAAFDASGEWQPLTVTVDDGRRHPGWWIRHGTFVLTVAAEVASEPPTALVQPPPLATAVPSHAWATSIAADTERRDPAVSQYLGDGTTGRVAWNRHHGKGSP